MIRKNIYYFVLAISLLGSSVCFGSESDEPAFNFQKVEELISENQWKQAESYLLKQLWNQQSGDLSIKVTEQLARVWVLLHKGPIAMEWLEAVDGSSWFASKHSSKHSVLLENLHRIYLPDRGFQYDPSFSLQGVDLNGPVNIKINSENMLMIQDRFRLLLFKENENGQYLPVPPTTPLPDNSISMKLLDSMPTIITRYGYWHKHRVYYFGEPDEWSRLIDGVYTTDNNWLVMDRRSAQMLVFDKNRKKTGELPVPTLNGDEKVISNIFGGCWLLHPSSRQILSVGSAFEVKIPFNGPGYALNEPIDMVSDQLGHLFVLCKDKVVTIFSPAGVRLQQIKLDPTDDLIKEVSAIAVKNDGKMFIADRKKHAILCYQ